MSAVHGADGSQGAQPRRQRERESLHFFSFMSRRLVTSLLLYGLIVEWLLPLAQVKDFTELSELRPLIIAVGLFLAVGLFVPPTWAAVLLNAVITAGTVLVMFSVHYASWHDSVTGLIEGLKHDAINMASGKMILSGETRTLLLVSGLGMMTVAVQSLIWLRQWGLGLAGLTALYLLLLYSFLGLDVLPGLKRACAEGLMLGALVTVPRLERLLGSATLFDGRAVKKSLAGWAVNWWNGTAWLAVIVLGAAIVASWSLSTKQEASEPAPWAAEAIEWGQNRLLEKQSGHGNSIGQRAVAEEAMAATGLGEPGMTGYGFDDSALGGPITPDHTAVFTVYAKENAYLRGESKSFYTGEGWEQVEHAWHTVSVSDTQSEHRDVLGSGGNSASGGQGAGGRENEQQSLSAEDSQGKLEQQVGSSGSSEAVSEESLAGAAGGEIDGESADDVFVQTITAAYPAAGWPLFAGSADAKVTDIRAVNGSGDTASYRQDAETGALYPSSEEDRIVRYTVASVMPDEALKRLRQVESSVDASAGVENGAGAGAGKMVGSQSAYVETAALDDSYTQLPDKLPAQIGTLTAEILAAAGNPMNRYEQVKAVEGYLRSNYKYTLQPKALASNTDFVDDFLFNQREGYCVHFASAMAVMLRTQGIPARYVKGFAPGEPAEGLAAGGAGLYTVRASDAHAWVEVFFPGVGWVAFEPTPGFAAPGSGVAGDALSAAGAGDGAKPALAAGDAAAGGEAARARTLAGRAAAQLRAAALQAAAAAQRGAHALAQAAQGAMAAPPWAMAAIAAGATGAAGLALAARRRSERFAFATALHRYGSALQAGRQIAARRQFLQLADACWRELYKRCGAKPMHRTAREYAAELSLPPHTAQLVADLVRWDEAARFDVSWHNQPTKEQLTELVAKLQSSE
ncbi:transglutaminase family protein [Paenibacillus sp. OV219]|uniref:transglutaminase-like domain-containing protein n=1 Tax=Paenibacillus sp. OV219 TaxID=1884377 RepID=UPI0008C5BFD0|nr:transglutaminase-like domain-containing protein [Paenibacillus sp. OV219]SEP02347.1 Transglutaminase-like enzyme, putative cysteine protease [Paenibacillus sp. OV219]